MSSFAAHCHQAAERKGAIEMYDQGRYFVVTGDHLPDTPTTIEERRPELAALHPEIFGPPAAASSARPPRPPEPTDLDDDAIIARAANATNGVKFVTLWSGDWQAAGYASQSEADAALCAMLAFWTGCDAARMDLLVRRSGLNAGEMGRRSTSPTAAPTARATIAHAIQTCRETCSGNGSARAAAPGGTRRARPPARPR